MKNKQQLMQKQDTQQQIKEKTQQLVKNLILFKNIEDKFKKTSIKLCSELIDLHRIKNPEYSFMNLIQEKELQDYSDVLETYVPYDVSPSVNKLYVEGKLSNTDMFVLKHTDKEFQTPKLQNKIVSGILTKKINSKELVRATSNQIREMIGEETNEMDEEKLIRIHILGNIANAKNNILNHKYWFKNKKNKELLIKNFNLLKNAIQFGLGINLK